MSAVPAGLLLGFSPVGSVPAARHEEEQGGELINSVEENETGGIKLYPNPAQDKLTIQQKLGFVVGTKIAIYNSLGQLMRWQIIDTASETVEIDISDLVAGGYFLRVGIFAQRFIISK